MTRTVLVVSDLHLGGPADFQICSAAGVENLTAFFRWARELQTTQGGVHLVLAGDVVDFRAEAPGGDLPCAEAVLDANVTPTVFLPADRAAFEAAWIRGRWLDPFRRLPASGAQVAQPTAAEMPFSACDGAAVKTTVEMGKRLDEKPVLVAILPPAGAPDPRRVREAITSWRECACGDVEEVALA